jgi:hypothetical protein
MGELLVVLWWRAGLLLLLLLLPKHRSLDVLPCEELLLWMRLLLVMEGIAGRASSWGEARMLREGCWEAWWRLAHDVPCCTK